MNKEDKAALLERYPYLKDLPQGKNFRPQMRWSDYSNSELKRMYFEDRRLFDALLSAHCRKRT